MAKPTSEPEHRGETGYSAPKAIVNIDLSEQVILKTDIDGNPLMEIATEYWPGNEVTFKFPYVNAWDPFTSRCLVLISRLVGIGVERGIPKELLDHLDLDDPSDKMQLAAYAIGQKNVSDDIVDIVVRYLRPEITHESYIKLREEMENDNTTAFPVHKSVVDRIWFKRNMPMDGVFRLLSAILSIDDWVKKNGIYLLSTIFQVYLTAGYSAKSRKNSNVPSQNSTKKQYLSSTKF